MEAKPWTNPTEADWLAWLAENPEPRDPPDEGATGAQIRAKMLWYMARNEALLRGEIPARGGEGLGECDWHDPETDDPILDRIWAERAADERRRREAGQA